MDNEHFNQLTPAEAERLALLAEECAEVIQVICKIQRHGYESYNPTVSDSPTNRQLLETELGHIMMAQSMCIAAGDIARWAVNHSAFSKGESVRKWLHHQKQ